MLNKKLSGALKEYLCTHCENLRQILNLRFVSENWQTRKICRPVQDTSATTKSMTINEHRGVGPQWTPRKYYRKYKIGHHIHSDRVFCHLQVTGYWQNKDSNFHPGITQVRHSLFFVNVLGDGHVCAHCKLSK